MFELAVQASQKILMVRQGPEMHDKGRRWSSGLEVQVLPSFLLFS
jgi:hypothetical protein